MRPPWCASSSRSLDDDPPHHLFHHPIAARGRERQRVRQRRLGVLGTVDAVGVAEVEAEEDEPEEKPKEKE